MISHPDGLVDALSSINTTYYASYMHETANGIGEAAAPCMTHAALWHMLLLVCATQTHALCVYAARALCDAHNRDSDEDDCEVLYPEDVRKRIRLASQ